MSLTFAELESITNDYFMIQGGKAVDIYFDTSFLLNYLLKQKKGIFERPDGGEKIRIPLEYDGQEAGFYTKGDTLSSDDRESLNAAYFNWKHAYGNATVYRIDLLKNRSDYAKVQLVAQRVAGAQKSLTKLLAGSIYDAPGGSTSRLDGLLACCNATTTVAYGGIAQADLQAQDGSYPWTGRVTTTSEAFDLPPIRTMATTAKVRDGKGGKIDLVVTTEALYNNLLDILQLQQRFVDATNSNPVKAGFTGINVEGKDVFPDDYCPSGYAFGLNSNHIGFAVHPEGNMMRSKWKVIEGSAEDKTMKIYFDGNMVVNNRKAQIAHSNLS